jgi:pheromone alpha factor receptor
MSTNSPPTSAMIPNPSFNPFTQILTILLPDGLTPVNTTLDQLDYFHHQSIEVSISKGVDLGASIILLFVLLLLTAPSKHRSPVFVANVAALACNVIRGVFKCVYLDSHMMDIYAQLTGDTQRIKPVDYGVSVAEAVFTWLTLLFVLASLLIQVRTVLLTLPSRWRRGVLVFLSLLGLATLALQMQETVVNIELILAFSALAENDPVLLRAMAMSMASMSVFVLIFTAKLGVAMVRRRRVGVKRFGAMEVLIIMGCQTLVVPSKSSYIPCSFHSS